MFLTYGEKLCSSFPKWPSSWPQAGPTVKAVRLEILSGLDSLKAFWGSAAKGNG